MIALIRYDKIQDFARDNLLRPENIKETSDFIFQTNMFWSWAISEM